LKREPRGFFAAFHHFGQKRILDGLEVLCIIPSAVGASIKTKPALAS
jgi:hypothetical protein